MSKASASSERSPVLEQDFTVERVAGTSVGALVAALVAAGYSGTELEAEVLAFPFDKVKRADHLDRLPVVGPALSIAIERGIWETTFVREYLAGLLERKGVQTFRDLKMRDSKSSLAKDRRYRLVVTATDVTTGDLLYLPWDYDERFGLDPNEQHVADAVAASIAIPFFFEPVKLTDSKGLEHVLVDGGVLSNFPDQRVRPNRPTATTLAHLRHENHSPVAGGNTGPLPARGHGPDSGDAPPRSADRHDHRRARSDVPVTTLRRGPHATGRHQRHRRDRLRPLRRPETTTARQRLRGSR